MSAGSVPVAGVQVDATAREQPLWFDANGESLFGVLTHPVGDARGVIVIAHSGGFWIPSTHRNRIYVRLARALAAEGFHTLRFDYHGTGESTGSAGYRLDRPFIDDSLAAIACARDLGFDRFVLIGSCFGARTAGCVAPGVAGLEGLAMFAPPLRDLRVRTEIDEESVLASARRVASRRVMRGLLDPNRRRRYFDVGRAKLRRAVRTPEDDGGGEVSRLFLKPLQQVVAAGVPVLLSFGTSDAYYAEFTDALPGRLGRMLADAGDQVTLDVIDGHMHSFTTLAAQDHVVATLARWLRDKSPVA